MKEVQQPSLDFKPLKEDSDYLIYSDGRLYSNKRQRFLKGKIDNVGYQVYRLAIGDKISSNSNKKKGKMLYAHRLVAEYFIPNPENLPYVHHKDENRLNNNLENLEWISAKDNSKEYYKKNPNKVNPTPRYHINNLEGEEWMELPFNAMYSVSNMGRVKNNNTNRLLRIDDCQKYQRVTLSSCNKKHYYLHRLVYCIFNNDFDLDGYVVDHIDNNPKNNRLDNLQKITHSENNKRQERFKK
jgi:hypothetical protein